MKLNSGFSKIAYMAVGLVLGIAMSVGAFFISSAVQSGTAADAITGTWLFDTIDSDASKKDRAMASLALQGAHLDMQSDGTGELSYLGTTVGLVWNKNDEGIYHISLEGEVNRVPGAPVLDTKSDSMIGHINEYDELFLSNENETIQSQSVFHRSNPDRIVPNALFETYDEFSHSVLADELSKESPAKDEEGSIPSNNELKDSDSHETV